MARIVLTASLLVAVLWPRAARAELPGVRAGRDAWLDARFEDAERQFLEATRDRTATRTDLVEAWRYLAAIRSARRAELLAEEAAIRAVSLDHAVTAPQGSPASTRALFDRVRQLVPASGLTATLSTPAEPVAGMPMEVEVVVRGDAGELAAAFDVSCGGAPGHASIARAPDADPRSRMRVEVPERGAGRCRGHVRTAEGAVLSELEAHFVAQPPVDGADIPATAGTGRSAEPDDRRRRGFPWAWTLVGAGAVAAGVVVAVLLTQSDGPEGARIGPPAIVE